MTAARDPSAAPEPLPGEPRFVLLARDPLAPLLVSLWGSLRAGDSAAAWRKQGQILRVAQDRYGASPDRESAYVALERAMAMIRWREAHDGEWRTPRPLTRWRRLFAWLLATGAPSCVHGSPACDDCYWRLQW